MQGVRRYGQLSDGGVRLELTPTTTSPLAITVAESTEMGIQRLICENPVIIFSRSSCYMCHVMKRLLSTVGVHPTIIELDEDEISAFTVHDVAGTNHHVDGEGGGGRGGVPALYIGGTSIGGLESLVALHLSGHLVSKLMEVGVLRKN
ncbi:glutaredoxin-C6-like [Olea europaea var. sylvestris]|uniref:Glutaredoxin-C6-like n=1 Tax=Olea europaea subsp. europaea TaxID=158383 RepID=A0A8S0RQ42_OLEEU|nr:glutaredoxin-C6-like [Olea europaea var. sylvestris]CAA2981432.1 glutaredoxin-C6-like [Olea europaea subsp. europaea]